MSAPEGVDEGRFVPGVPGVPWRKDPATGSFTWVGPQAEALLGHSSEDWYAPGFWDRTVHPDDRAAARDYGRHQTEAGANHSLEYRMIAADGREVWVRDEVRVEEDVSGNPLLHGLTVDITAAKERTQQLAENEARLSHAQRMARLGGWQWDPVDDRLSLSPEAMEMLGFRTREGSLADYLAVVPERERQRVRAAIDHVVQHRRPFGLEHSVRASPRGIHSLHSQATWHEGRVVGTWQDVSERRMVEQAMRSLAHTHSTSDIEAFLRRVVTDLARHYGVRFAFIGLLQADLRRVRTEVVWAGDGYAENFEYDLKGTPCADILNLSKELIPQFAADLYPEDEMLVDMGIDSYFGAPLVGSDGQTMGILTVMDTEPLEPTLWSAPILGLYASRVAVELERLIELRTSQAERERLEGELAQARRLEALGRLAGGVAHDFNNLLMIILGNAEALKGAVMNAEQQEELDDIVGAAERAKSLTGQLLAFGRRQHLQPRGLDLAALVGGMKPLLQRLVGAEVELRVRAAHDLRMVRGDPAQLEQVVLNLVANARDATPEGGRVDVEIRNHDGSSSDEVVLTVRDEGGGMDDDTRSRLFEPFFTTRDQGHGLGLATVYGIIDQSGGRIEVESELGVGSQFFVYLPAAEEASSKHPSSVPAPRRAARRIVVVDDDPSVLAVTVRMLDRAGHAVRGAASGTEALALVAEDGAIDLVVTDVSMPGMSGLELADELGRRWPELPVILVSGHAAPPALGPTAHAERRQFLAKPFRRQDLVRHVERMTGEGEPGDG